jgi:tetratricopeptide (TPR) repeat protein
MCRHVCLALFLILAPARADKPRTYALSNPPIEVYDRLSDLGVGPMPKLSDAERKLLGQVWELKAKKPGEPVRLDDEALLDALVFASGVEASEGRRKYRERFDALLADAKKAVAGAKDTRDRGERLMKFLHGGVMNKGYAGDQTSFTSVFDTGKFNCVSAVAVYHQVGARLGMELRPISIPGPGGGALPGHASLDLVDGTERVQVEPTNPNGFDWETKVKKPGVIVLGFVPDRKTGHEVDAIGVAAMIYSNRGVALTNAKPPKWEAAARCYLAALALDPIHETATNNLQSLFTNWGPALVKEKKYEEAVRVLTFGAEVAPKADKVKNNLRFVWAEYIEATLEAKKDGDVAALAGRAGKAVPDDKEFASPAHWFDVHAQKRARKGDWEAALGVVDRGLKVVPSADAKTLRDGRSKLFRLWSQSLLNKQDVDGSLKVMARGYALDPKAEKIQEGIKHHVGTALEAVEKTSGVPAMLKHFEAVRDKFPDLELVREAGVTHAALAIQELTHRKKFADAVAVLETYKPLLAKPEDRVEVGARVYDRWAQHLADESGKKDWKAAVDKYAEGLKAFPGHGGLTQNAVYMVHQWAKPAMQAEKWDDALAVCKEGLDRLPGNEKLLELKKYCEERKKGK